MSDYTLASGKEITFDLEKLSHKDWNDLNDSRQAKKKSDEILARVFNLTVDELGSLRETEYRKLVAVFVRRVITPISSDPNA